MRLARRRTVLALAVAGFAACAESGPTPVIPPDRPRLDVTADWTADWIISDLSAEHGEVFSFDTTQSGLEAPVRYDSYVAEGDGREFCRDHFRPIDLWWDGGYGIAVIHLDPPLLFRGYRPGTFRDRRSLVWRRAIYETIQAGEGIDPAGNVWRFRGRFNALCRGGSREIGPIVFNSQLLVSQDPIDRPVLVRRGTGEGCEKREDLHDERYTYYDDGSEEPACGGDGDGSGSGTQYQHGDYTGGETVDWNSGMGNGGTSVCGTDAKVEYICIDIWVEGQGWVEWSCGYATTC
jgi:hypothetical protein